MPTITDVIALGALNETERQVLTVLENNKGHIFSTTLQDLIELAAWCMAPKNCQPPEIPEQAKFELNKKI